MHWLTGSDFRFHVALSRWRPWRHFTQCCHLVSGHEASAPRLCSSVYASSWSVVHSYLMYQSLTHSLTGPLDQRRVVAPSRCRDHWPCPKQHLQRARHRPPAGGSMYVGDDLVDVSTPVWHQVGDRHGYLVGSYPTYSCVQSKNESKSEDFFNRWLLAINWLLHNLPSCFVAAL